ncbi:hypothetical protein ACI01nite_21140 [Acetobacter cibinongensis]|uniref:Uncharacterized protein n=1 Tax=Acetobacter cibinongensis TaxID=146475 RepID=A0A0D6MZL9_9PROT|nr:hypothetical protein [Acetobacter cibinongensis]GAN59134.1 hypothetical protein Abci_002_011 [Acetobacter cibinongensis]GBQ19063.1 hypothetical protein AA0482_2447 [Acetobacter cibinongensis NRIC 0482]GEL59512.1 hypothetical protein ACI01nite_21140 [Acetobacter cibinongensis]
MPDKTTRLLTFFSIAPAVALPFSGSLDLTDWSKGLVAGVLVGLQLLSIMQLYRHKCLRKPAKVRVRSSRT